MPKQHRVHEIAKELGVPAKVVIAWLSSEGEEVKSAAARLSESVTNRVRNTLGSPTIAELSREFNVPLLVLIDYLRVHGLDCSDPDEQLQPSMAKRLRLEFRPKKTVPLPPNPAKRRPTDASKVLWCPLCEWRATDSVTTRQHMGLHLADSHYSDIAFPMGTEPDDLEPA